MAAVAVAIFALTYALIASERVNRTVAALIGAGLMLLTQILDSEEAFHDVETGVDWEVILLLLGMMLIVAVMRRTGLFEYLAIWSAKRAKGRPFRILVILCVVTAFVSALLDNVTTVLLVAPVTILIAERLGVNPVPYLIAEVLASNIGGASTLVGDPPNIIIGVEGGLSYTDFLVNMAPVVIVILVVFVALARVLFRKDLYVEPDRVAEVMELDEREAIRNWALLVRSLIVLALVTVGFVLEPLLGYEPSTVALIGGGVLFGISGQEVRPIIEDVEWGTLLFFVGLFILVGGLVETGVIDAVAERVTDVTGGSGLVASQLIIWVSGVLSALVGNIPYVAAMAPVVSQLIAGLGAAAGGTALWWAMVLGADLGGNATIVGAGANVVVVGISGRSGHPIKFGDWLKYGVVVSVVSLAMSSVYVWLRYFLVA